MLKLAGHSYDPLSHIEHVLIQQVYSFNRFQKTTDGDCGLLANTMNDFFVSVSDHLPRLNKSHKVFDVNEELPDHYVISVWAFP